MQKFTVSVVVSASSPVPVAQDTDQIVAGGPASDGGSCVEGTVAVSSSAGMESKQLGAREMSSSA